MAKKYKHIVISYARASRINRRPSKFYCPRCYDNDTFNIIRKRDGWYECRACGYEYATDQRRDEEFD